MFINDTFVAKLDLSDLLEPGDVSVFTGYILGDEVEGETTHFEDFAVWALQ